MSLEQSSVNQNAGSGNQDHGDFNIYYFWFLAYQHAFFWKDWWPDGEDGVCSDKEIHWVPVKLSLPWKKPGVTILKREPVMSHGLDVDEDSEVTEAQKGEKQGHQHA